MICRSQMSKRDTVVIGGASIADGLVCLFTLGLLFGTMRHRASLWAARRASKGEGA